ncbi:MAG: hypothetical protein ACNI27_02545 [Desulfovibrio sp.]
MTKSWFWTFAALSSLTFILGLCSVWVNIERLDVAYTLRTIEKKLDKKSALVAKLEVERNNLLSPYQLQKLAKKYGLRPAKSGQIRRMEDSLPTSEP